MKTIYKKLILLVVLLALISAILYGAGAGSNGLLSIAKWSEESRACLMGFWAVFALISVIVALTIDNDGINTIMGD